MQKGSIYKGCDIMFLKKYKKQITKILLILLAVLAAGALLAIFVVPFIPIKNVDSGTYKLIGDNEVYERAYNLYGRQIYKKRSKALAQFKKDYKETLDYMSANLSIDEFKTSFNTVSAYERKGWQYTFTEDEKRELGEEKVEELEHNMRDVTLFCSLYKNTNWRYYIPFLSIS